MYSYIFLYIFKYREIDIADESVDKETTRLSEGDYMFASVLAESQPACWRSARAKCVPTWRVPLLCRGVKLERSCGCNQFLVGLAVKPTWAAHADQIYYYVVRERRRREHERRSREGEVEKERVTGKREPFRNERCGLRHRKQFHLEGRARAPRSIQRPTWNYKRGHVGVDARASPSRQLRRKAAWMMISKGRLSRIPTHNSGILESFNFWNFLIRIFVRLEDANCHIVTAIFDIIMRTVNFKKSLYTSGERSSRDYKMFSKARYFSLYYVL